jgi:hypothetical protein
MRTAIAPVITWSFLRQFQLDSWIKGGRGTR